MCFDSHIALRIFEFNIRLISNCGKDVLNFEQKNKDASIPGSIARQECQPGRGSSRSNSGEFSPSQRAPEKRWISIHYKQTHTKNNFSENQVAAELQQIKKKLWSTFPSAPEKSMNV